MIFITNITLKPFLFYVGPELCLKISRRAKARLDLLGKNPKAIPNRNIDI